MPLTSAQLQVLDDQGWAVTTSESFDLCWIDCNRAGWLKTWRSRRTGRALCLCLCPEHALCLEEGAFAGDYSGAPLPPDSMTDEWPWRLCAEVEAVP